MTKEYLIMPERKKCPKNDGRNIRTQKTAQRSHPNGEK
jgi:hypothetical protein